MHPRQNPSYTPMTVSGHIICFNDDVMYSIALNAFNGFTINNWFSYYLLIIESWT